jgi:hypothetical protein
MSYKYEQRFTSPTSIKREKRLHISYNIYEQMLVPLHIFLQ